jgi:hypothetical protein
MESTSCAIPSTHTAGDATLHSLLADTDDLSLNSLAIQRLGHLTQRRESVAIVTRTSINQKNLFHKTFIIFGCKYNDNFVIIIIFAIKICENMLRYHQGYLDKNPADMQIYPLAAIS